MTPGRAFYEEQIRLLVAGDAETLVETHYTADAVLLGNNGQDFVVRCNGDQRPLLEHFRAYLALLGSLRVESTDRFIETEGAITFEATVHCERFGRVRVYDAWAMRDGKIAIHFTGVFPSAPQPSEARMEPRQIIDKYYEYVNKADWASWLTLFDDKVVGDEQIAGHFEGIGALRGAGDGINEGYSTFQMLPQQVVVSGDEAAVVWRCDAASKGGVPIAYPGDPARPVIGANYFRFANGKITYMRTVHDLIPFQPFVQKSHPYRAT